MQELRFEITTIQKKLTHNSDKDFNNQHENILCREKDCGQFTADLLVMDGEDEIFTFHAFLADYNHPADFGITRKRFLLYGGSTDFQTTECFRNS